MAKSMIPGGPTDEVRQAGGYDLFVALALSMGGKSFDVCAYALIRALAIVAINIDNKEAAVQFLRDAADDAINELELNWPDRDQLIGDAIASASPEVGHG